MSTAAENNKRIAKNTLLLYFRMILLMLIGLYTSRVILNALGIQNFGIYNVIGGFVTMFSVISSSLSTAISRFLTFELGKKDDSKLITVFSSAVTIQVGLAIIIVILTETIGLWFVNAKMVIPADRMFAARCVFHFSILAFCIDLISVPYNAAIIAHEKMSAFAYISIIEAAFKLLIAFLIMVSPIDRLVFYSMLMSFVAIIIRVIYGIYCKHHFRECTYHFVFNKPLLKEMTSFAGWSFIGNSAGILRNQGVNVLLNLYCGPIVNAANGIATQVNNAISGFYGNFMVAVNPQITKQYSQGKIQDAYGLVKNSSRLSFMLMLLLTTPIIIEAPFILKIWLKMVPGYTVDFVRLILILSLVECLSIPLVTLQQATGKLRNYQLVVGTTHLLNFPLSWLFLKLNFAPNIVYIIAILLAAICLYARLIMLKRIVDISISSFTYQVTLKCLVVFTVIYLSLILFHKMQTVTNPIWIIVISILISFLCIIAIGIKPNERKKIVKIIER